MQDESVRLSEKCEAKGDDDGNERTLTCSDNVASVDGDLDD